ncbi:hypothetical protein HD806DRAFT_520563 [Xylariaceae sp. AK1471]|nr:hypothetical protein HD806DRAFT_520563 [Xylariaceae sp. AK1471]
MTMLSKPHIQILSQYIDGENGYYRLRVGRRIHYLTISSGVFGDNTMCWPYTIWDELRVDYDGAPAIAKIACFKWDIARIERETRAYSIMARHHSQYPNETMGFLLQKVNGEPTRVNDLANCEALLRGLYPLGLIHGDVNQHKFSADWIPGSGMRLVDSEHGMEVDEGLARVELLSLPAELAEETSGEQL